MDADRCNAAALLIIDPQRRGCVLVSEKLLLRRVDRCGAAATILRRKVGGSHVSGDLGY
jgi:hypothetical protein